MVTRETLNVLQCGLGLCLILFAFLAMSSIEETTLSDMCKRKPEISCHSGYYSQTIIYGVFIFSNLIAPPIVALLGCRWSLVFGSACYTLFMSHFLYLSNFTLYGGSALEGLGAGFMWTASGYYMALNSDEKTIGRNSSLMWLLSCSSNIAGGIYLLIVFSTTDSDDIDEGLTTILYGTFCGVALVGNIVFAFSRTSPKEVYPTSLSFTTQFPLSSKMVLGMNNLAVGVGQVTGCLFYIFADKFVVRIGRFSGLLLGTAFNIIALTIIGLNLPMDAPLAETTSPSVIPPNAALACIAGLLLGLVDASFETQLYALTSSLYEENCAQAMALFKFYHAVLSTCSMFYGGELLLPYQLGLLALSSIAATLAFTAVERPHRRSRSHVVQPVLSLSKDE